eukprot:9485627-Pyramimonas_sp.AAC.1
MRPANSGSRGPGKRGRPRGPGTQLAVGPSGARCSDRTCACGASRLAERARWGRRPPGPGHPRREPAPRWPLAHLYTWRPPRTRASAR